MQSSYGIGGIEIKPQTSESVTEISPNRTLFVEQFTEGSPLIPELVSHLHDLASVFDYYQPQVQVTYTDAAGRPINEELAFRQLSDFGKNGIIAQSNFLAAMSRERDLYLQVLRHVSSNKILQSALSSPDARLALLQAVSHLKALL
ncbi:hypothetical protein [Chitinophaga sp. Cy-1792]|uniref:hypothetical protein n=1 Tax=Chitinophaga sp. Cy-1792 TaxID=2608339 RepID=UPI00142152B7|nr:hypothetical protein [Chitinophaga sp. Cy-1792]NIG53725.1 hypothetical protein [Chitinophaga sp. Cy-1792]